MTCKILQSFGFDKNETPLYAERVLKHFSLYGSSVTVALLIVVCAGHPSEPAHAGTPPAPLNIVVDALDPHEELRVDLAQRFWSWKADTRHVTRFDSAGRRDESVQLVDGVSVDAHSEWGILRLVSGGEELRHFDWQGRLQASLPMDGPAGAVRWIDSSRVAVTPERSASWAEIWDLTVGARVRALGEATPVETTPGGRFSRGVHVQPVPAKNRLYTLESRTGEVRIFSYPGETLRTLDIDNPRLEQYDEWLANVAPDYVTRGEAYTPTIWQLDLAVSPNGSLWTDPACGPPNGRLSLAELPEEGNVKLHQVTSTCCPQGLTIWKDWLILWNPPGRPQPACRDLRRLP